MQSDGCFARGFRSPPAANVPRSAARTLPPSTGDASRATAAMERKIRVNPPFTLDLDGSADDARAPPGIQGLRVPRGEAATLGAERGAVEAAPSSQSGRTYEAALRNMLESRISTVASLQEEVAQTAAEQQTAAAALAAAIDALKGKRDLLRQASARFAEERAAEAEQAEDLARRSAEAEAAGQQSAESVVAEVVDGLVLTAAYEASERRAAYAEEQRAQQAAELERASAHFREELRRLEEFAAAERECIAECVRGEMDAKVSEERSKLMAQVEELKAALERAQGAAEAAKEAKGILEAELELRADFTSNTEAKIQQAEALLRSEAQRRQEAERLCAEREAALGELGEEVRRLREERSEAAAEAEERLRALQRRAEAERASELSVWEAKSADAMALAEAAALEREARAASSAREGARAEAESAFSEELSRTHEAHERRIEALRSSMESAKRLAVEAAEQQQVSDILRKLGAGAGGPLGAAATAASVDELVGAVAEEVRSARSGAERQLRDLRSTIEALEASVAALQADLAAADARAQAAEAPARGPLAPLADASNALRDESAAAPRKRLPWRRAPRAPGAAGAAAPLSLAPEMVKRSHDMRSTA